MKLSLGRFYLKTFVMNEAFHLLLNMPPKVICLTFGGIILKDCLEISVRGDNCHNSINFPASKPVRRCLFSKM